MNRALLIRHEKEWKKRDDAIREAATKQDKKDLGPLFDDVADTYQAAVYKMKNGTQKSHIPAIKRAQPLSGQKDTRNTAVYDCSIFTIFILYVSDYCVKSKNGYQLYFPTVVYLCTGERRGEACAIQLQDIDFSAGIII